MEPSIRESPTFRRECASCGEWHVSACCPTCGDPATAPTGRPEIRLLLELVLDPTGTLVLRRVVSARLPWVGTDPMLVLELGRTLAEPHDDWQVLRAVIDPLTVRRVAETVSRHTGVPLEAVRAGLRVSVHLLVQTPDATSLPSDGWRVTPFEASVTDGAAALRDDGLVLETDSLALVPYDHAQAAVVARAERVVLVQEAALTAGGAVVASRKVHHLLAEGHPTAVDLPPLTTSTAHRLVSSPNDASVALRLLGRDAPFQKPLAGSSLSRLPAPERRLHLVLDVGASTARSVIVYRQNGTTERENWHFDETDRFLRQLELPHTDNGGGASWIAAALPALARAAVARHDRWLDGVSVAVASAQFAATALADGALAAASAQHVLGARVRVVARGTAIAAHYLPAIRELADHEDRHERTSRDTTEKFQRRVEAWHKQVAARRDPFWSLVTADPGDAPDPPPDYAPLGLASRNLRQALMGGGHYVVIDAGARALEATFFKGGGGTEVRWAAGGDEVSNRLRVDGEPADASVERTRRARLGDERDPAVRACREATLAVYQGAMAEIGTCTSISWAPDQPWFAIVTGGAARSPFFREQLAAVLAAHPAFSCVVDVAWLARAARMARTREFAVPRLERLLRIAAQEGEGRGDDYTTGTFDVVAGMLALAEASS